MLVDLANSFSQHAPKKARALQKQGIFLETISEVLEEVERAYRNANSHISSEDFNGQRMLNEMIFQDALASLIEAELQ